MKKHADIVVFAAALLLLVAGMPAAAADNHTYFRLGVGLDQLSDTRFLDTDCRSESPAALYGCGPGKNGDVLSTVGGFGGTSAFEVGWGRTVTSTARLELSVDYRPHHTFRGTANFLAPGRMQSVEAGVSSWSGLMSAYLDLPPVQIGNLRSGRPFVGAGFGAGRNVVRQMLQTFPRTTTVVPGGAWTGRVWMLTAGMAIPLGDAASLDVAWRYTDAGFLETGRGEGRVIWRDGSREPLVLDLAPTRARLQGHGIRVSLRYAY
ncbi:MAG: outer membrane beta-barrel protein [Rhodospirillales bacterium]|nr:outer membrane beta-barrel protein [Rhodospirillales bacterium]